MIMNNMSHLRNIQSTGSQIGRNQHMTTTVTEFVERTFAVRLFHTTMKTFRRQFFIRQ